VVEQRLAANRALAGTALVASLAAPSSETVRTSLPPMMWRNAPDQKRVEALA